MKRKRLLLLLALLMTAATGAWAQTSDKATPLTLQATADGKIFIYNPKDGMHYYKVGDGEKQTVTGTGTVEIPVNEGQTVQFFGNGTTIKAYGVEDYADDPGTYFDSSVPCYIYGNIMSLVDETGFATATVLIRPNAFNGLFNGFSNLLNHPTRKLVLPATTLAKRCYNGMFQFCSSLTTAPELPAMTLAERCYAYMFSGCTSLNAVTCLATDISAQGATDYWLGGVAATGTLTIAKGMKDKWAAKSTDDGIPSGWSTDVYGFKVKLADGTADAGNWTATLGTSTTAQPLPVGGLSKGDAVTLTYGGRLKVKSVTATTDAEPDPLATPLTIEALTAGTIKLDMDDGPLALDIQYSVNGGDKETITQTTNITVAKGDKVQFYGNGFHDGGDGVRIQGSGEGFQTKGYGNIMSLLDETGFATKTELPKATYVFFGLFLENTTLIDASELLLPDATLAYACYQRMFQGCTSLTTAPKLPATTLADGCYASMFYGCTKLTQAPALPATELADGCYAAMFMGCTSLTTAPKLPATTLAYACYEGMFQGCTSLTSAYVKAAYTEEDNKCSDMFNSWTATDAVLHTTPDNKDSWVTKMGTDWDNWSVEDDWED